jgi:hypothetical protein
MDLLRARLREVIALTRSSRGESPAQRQGYHITSASFAVIHPFGGGFRLKTTKPRELTVPLARRLRQLGKRGEGL